MRDEIINATNDYLDMFSGERERLAPLLSFLESSNSRSVYDWNNDGHVTVGGFVYARDDDKFLVLYHKDLDMYLYPGGHIDLEDKTLLDAVYREVFEETGISNLSLAPLCSLGMPIDIDIHLIPYNERVGMREHYHYDFRYLYFTDSVCSVKYDSNEMSSYKWVPSHELINDKNFGNTVGKLMDILEKEAI